MESPLITHIFIEAYFNHDGLLTEEHLKSSEERKQLFESYGIFDGCKEAAEEIETAVIFKNNDNSPVITVSPKSLTFVNKVTVYLISEKIGKGAYDETKTKVNKDGTFDEIVIYLNNDTSSKEMITTFTKKQGAFADALFKEVSEIFKTTYTLFLPIIIGIEVWTCMHGIIQPCKPCVGLPFIALKA